MCVQHVFTGPGSVRGKTVFVQNHKLHNVYYFHSAQVSTDSPYICFLHLINIFFLRFVLFCMFKCYKAVQIVRCCFVLFVCLFVAVFLLEYSVHFFFL